MRAGLIAVLVIIALLAASPKGAQNKNPDQAKPEAGSNRQEPASSTRMLDSEPAQENQSSNGEAKANREPARISTNPTIQIGSHKDGWDKALVVFTGLIVIVGGFQIYFLWGTVEATKDNAFAARESATATIIENRPWLLLTKIENPHLTPAVEVPHSEQRITHCYVWTQNFGKTPAMVTTLWGRMLIGDSPIAPPRDLNIEIATTSPIPEPYVFPPAKPLPAEAQLSPEGFISPQVRDDILKRKVKYLWVCGFVKYRNTFEGTRSPNYETRFCHLYETRTNSPEPFWTPAGPPEYNRAT
jgi:hypothetical protein